MNSAAVAVMNVVTIVVMFFLQCGMFLACLPLSLGFVPSLCASQCPGVASALLIICYPVISIFFL